MKIQLSDHFTYQRLLRFTLPSIIMMVFTSIYSMVDGFFISNFVGKTPFAAINMVWPTLGILHSTGMMVGTGGSAIVGLTLGEGGPDCKEKAHQYFSLFVYTVLALGVIFCAVGLVILEPLCVGFGAQGALLDNCLLYGRVLLPATPFFMLQFSLQSFFVTAEKPKLGLGVTVLSGMLNIVLDALFIIVFGWELMGAAVATALSQTIGTVVALIYFARPNTSLLRLTRHVAVKARLLLKACSNGLSEMVSNLAGNLIAVLYNFQLMRYIGEDGVSAMGIVFYVGFLFLAVFFGYVTGIGPVVSFHYGAGHRDEVKSLYRKSLNLIYLSQLAMTAASFLLARPLAMIFTASDPGLLDLTAYALRIYALAFLFRGISIFGSAFFTALNDGVTSALISFLRAFVFQVGMVFLLPLIWGLDGIWYSTVASEFFSAAIAVWFFWRKRQVYGYW